MSRYFDKVIDIILEGRFVTAKRDNTRTLFANQTVHPPIKQDESQGLYYFSRADTLRQAQNAIDDGKPFFIAGEPGVSKSVSIKQLAQKQAQKMGRTYVVWNDLDAHTREALVQRTPEAEAERKKYYVLMDIRTNLLSKEDATGIPDVMNTLEYTKYRPMIWLHYATFPGTAGMIFFDEMNQGTEDVLKSLMQLFLDRQIGDNRIADGWAIAAAGNVGSKFGNTEIPIALRQRARMLGMTVTSKEWTEYAKNVGIDDLIIAFVNSGFKRLSDGSESNPYLVQETDLEGKQMEGGASPRSIEEFSKVYTKIYKKFEENPNFSAIDEIKQAAMSIISKEWADEFIAFAKFAGKFDNEKFQEDLDLYVNEPGKYIAKYGLSEQQAQELSTASQIAAEDINKRYFQDSKGRSMMAMIYQVMQELLEAVQEIFAENEGVENIKLTPEQKQTIKEYIEFTKLMEDSGNPEINAILANMSAYDMKPDENGIQRLVASFPKRVVIVKILNVIQSEFANKLYERLFKKTFNNGVHMVEGKFEESEESENSDLPLNKEQFNKLMQIKRNIEMLDGLKHV